MIKNILLKFGRAPGLINANIEATPVTVFVSPNNSGKSKVLQEIHRFCTDGRKSSNDVVLDSLTFESVAREKVDEIIGHVRLPPQYNESLQPDHIIIGKRGTRNHVPKERLTRVCMQNIE